METVQTPSLAEEIFEAVFAELSDRRGFTEWWLSIEAKTRTEIERECVAAVDTQIESSYPDQGEVYGYPSERGY